MRRWCLAVVAVLTVGGIVSAVPAPKGSSVAIVYVTGQPGNMQIVTVGTGTLQMTYLTDVKANNLFPAVSPDGRKIAFSSDREGVQHVCVMDADGKNVKQLTKGQEVCRAPTWSPDGKKIAFIRHVNGASPNIWMMDADGANANPITKGFEFMGDPAFSPDGKKIAYAAHKTGRNGFCMYVMDVDGTNHKQLSFEDNVFGMVYPAWSPDGKQIAYADRTAAGALELFVCDAEGKNRKQLTKLGGQNSYAAWLPGGKQIVFFHADGGTTSVRVIDADGGNGKVIVDKTSSTAEGGRVSVRP